MNHMEITSYNDNMLLILTGWEIGPEKVDVADTLICHARYNESIFDKHLPSDVKWVVPVRDAVSWMKSCVLYFHAIARAVCMSYTCTGNVVP